MTDLVTLTRAGDVAIVALNRPDAANAINHAMAAQLRDAARAVQAQGWARVVLLRAEGKMFSGGGDVGAMLASRAEGDQAAYGAFFTSLVAGFHEAVLALRAVGVPLVAAVHGVAAGGGMSLALACDVALAGPRARFVPAYPAIGLSTDGGLSWSLPRLVGARKALAILLENKPINADEALALGLVSSVIAAEDFGAAALEYAHQLARLPRQALAHLRALIENSNRHSLAEHLDLELAAMAMLSVAPDAGEGLDAYAEKRPPQFKD